MTKTMTMTKTKTKASTEARVAPKKGRQSIAGRIRNQSDIPIPRKTVKFMAAMSGVSNATSPDVALNSDRIFTCEARRLIFGALWVASCGKRVGIKRSDVQMAASLMN
jgi:hypothetical protein